MRSVVRKILAGLAILLVLAIVAAAGVAAWAARRPVPQASGRLTLDVLDEPVDVYRDGFGVPHIYADTAHDLFVAQGFVHAQDRFWEMDIRRHTTAGRLSELFGESQVETDRYIRTMGWRRVAEQEWPLLAPETQQMLRDYAEGVNAYLRGRTPEQLSLEYAVLELQRPGYFPEPWTPVDSLAWLKAMAWDLRDNTEDEISRVELTETLSVEQVEELWPPFPFDLREPIVPDAGAASAGGTATESGAGAADTGTGANRPNGSAEANDRGGDAGGGDAGGGDADDGGGGGARQDRDAGGGASEAGARGDGRTGKGESAAIPVGGDLRGMVASSLAASTLDEARPLLAQLSDDLAGLPDMLGPSGSGLGSNSFVVAGDRTTTGLPLLANDPHLAPALPSIWYQMALHCRTVSDACPYAVTGVTFSGMPGVVIGHNERIAWGFTNLGPDVADLVLERIDGDSYEHAGRNLPLEERTETIRVAGGDDVTITVRETGHGPLLSDASQELQSIGDRAPAATATEPLAATATEPLAATATEPPAATATEPPAGGDAATGVEPGDEIGVAMRWTALRPGRTADAIVALNRATDWDEFRAAASLFEVPAQNIVYADVDGNIGYQAPGRIPLRAPGDDGRWPVAGWTGASDWHGTVAFDDLPSLFNPAEGFIVTANQPVIAEGAGPFLSRDHDYGWRSQRLRDLLSEARDLEPADLLSIQTDAHNGIAEVLVPLLTAVEVPGDVEPARALLEDWDFQQNADSAAGAYFAGVWRHLLQRTFADDLPRRTDIEGDDRWMEVVRRLVGDPDAQWWDDARTDQREGRDDILRAALVDAHTELAQRLGGDPAQWRWGELHTLQLRHMTLGSSDIPAIEWVFNRGSVQVGGGSGAIDATGWDVSAGYQVDWVPSMRMVVDLFDWDASRWINLTGASGHAFSPHYTDQVERWATGGSTPMRWSLRAVRAAAADHLVLVPSSGDGE